MNLSTYFENMEQVGRKRKMNINLKIKSFLVGAMVTVGLMAVASPSVTIGEVATGAPWSTVTVNYTLGGLDADLDYKVAFDVTANGVTRGVTNAAAKLTDGSASKVIDTTALFGVAKADPKAKVRVSLIAVKPLPGVQLWEGGPYWAECNVGATKPEEYGYYFWWGDTVGYKRNANNDGWVSAADGTTGIVLSELQSPANTTCGKDNSWLESNGYIDGSGNLTSTHDAATAHLGALWRMPTSDEIGALRDKTKMTWTTKNGVYGYLVEGVTAGYTDKSIFLPASGSGYDSNFWRAGSGGSYWSSTPYYAPGYVFYLYFDSDHSERGNTYPCAGFSVRPVRGFAK